MEKSEIAVSKDDQEEDEGAEEERLVLPVDKSEND